MLEASSALSFLARPASRNSNAPPFDYIAPAIEPCVDIEAIDG